MSVGNAQNRVGNFSTWHCGLCTWANCLGSKVTLTLFTPTMQLLTDDGSVGKRKTKTRHWVDNPIFPASRKRWQVKVSMMLEANHVYFTGILQNWIILFDYVIPTSIFFLHFPLILLCPPVDLSFRSFGGNSIMHSAWLGSIPNTNRVVMVKSLRAHNILLNWIRMACQRFFVYIKILNNLRLILIIIKFIQTWNN